MNRRIDSLTLGFCVFGVGTIFFMITGCLGSSQNNTLHQDAPVIHTPPPVTTAEPVPGPAFVAPTPTPAQAVTKTDEIATTNATQNALTGLLNFSVSKFAEKMTGFETTLNDLIHASLNFTNQMNARMDTSLSADANVKAELHMMATTTATLSNQMTAITDLKVSLGKIEAQLAVNANAQIGLSNEIKNATTTMTSGRDINYLPKEAVDMFKMMAYVAIALIVLAGTIFGIIVILAFKNERDEHRRTHSLLLHTLAMLPEEHRRELSKAFGGQK